MKIRAGRGPDEADIKNILQQLSARTLRELREVHSAVDPHDGIPWRKDAAAPELIRQVLEEGVGERADQSKHRELGVDRDGGPEH